MGNIQGIEGTLEGCLSRDRPGLIKAIGRLRQTVCATDPLPQKIVTRIELSRRQVIERDLNAPRPEFPSDLPVSALRADIAAAIQAHQVVIVCGETGSGKTTQLPKICLDIGRGRCGLIGHTQPRRIAARATAERIAKELGSELGRHVGYTVRFSDRTSEQSYIKLMTDGILLAETQHDRTLSRYDTIIIDEAHERSLNIDFLLGYLKQLLPRRPDLKLIVTSATLDAERFARHFESTGRAVPVIEVSGRLYPIEMRWRPFEPSREADMHDAVCEAVDEVFGCGPGDVLVFLPGEREIRECAEALRKHHSRLPGIKPEVLPLFARQSAQEQARVFQRSNGRRVVLATNVAETSLTVPGIRYVVDTGLARVKRYSFRNKVEQLLVEPVAQSAARQRAGRCGRVASGVCIRLYEEEAFNQRSAHTDPEILRSSLASVILRMKSLGLGEVEAFPFIDPPTSRAIADGYQLLSELGAVDEARALTALGWELAKLPLDPKVARMILAGRQEQALSELLVICAGLSVQDPRDRPQEAAGSADQAHAKFADERSEFLWYLKAWTAFDEIWRHQSQSKQREWCRAHFLSWMRMREWRDVHTQLHTLCAEHEWKENTEVASVEAIHRALLTGLLGNLGCRIDEVRPGDPPFLGARGIKFWPHPGSTVARKAGKWIMVAELTETSRLFGRCIARIEPEWVEQVGAHLVRRSTYEPHWSKARGETVAWERGVIHGLTLYARRAVQFGKQDPVLARELLIREGLVNGELPEGSLRHMKFLKHNQSLVHSIESLEERQRRPDLLVDEALIEAFYADQIPEHVIDLRSFERWRKEAESEQPKRLFLSREQLMRHDAAGVTTERFPAQLHGLGQTFKLEYRHEPGAADDGVSLCVPLALLNQLPAARLEWLVPGMLEEKVTQLLKTVPQKLRHRLQPISQFAREFCAEALDVSEPLLNALSRVVEARIGLKLPADAIRSENLPSHLLMNVRVFDEHGRLLGQSRNLAELRSRLRADVERQFAQVKLAGAVPEQGAVSASRPAAVTAIDAALDLSQLSGLKSWTFGTLPELMEVRVGGREVIGFPGLVDEGETVALRVFDTPEKAAEQHRAGLRRLFALELREQVKYIEKNLPGLRDMAMQFMALGSEAELRTQIVNATLERCCLMDPLPGDAVAFAARKEEARARLTLVAQEFARLAAAVLGDYTALTKRLAALKAHPEALEDMRAQLSALVNKSFVARTPFERLVHVPRYLKAMGLRLEKLRVDPARDARAQSEWRALAQPWQRESIALARNAVHDPALENFRWLLEELRVQLFAQELRTPVPVSVKRLQKIWEARAR